MADYLQHAPFSVQVELVEGCSMACSFCGINGIRKRPGNFKYADMSMLEYLAEEIDRCKWSSRIEFAMHGEPSLHPNVVDCIAVFRDRLPKTSLMMTSNGSGFIGDRIKNIAALAEAGLNILALDDYRTVNYVAKVRKALFRDYSKIVVRDYPKDRSASIHQKRVPGNFEVVCVEDIFITAEGNHSKLFNHAGQAAPKDYTKQDQRCAFPFREISIRWDGNVALCCDDFRGTYKIGNIRDMPLDELWQHPRFVAARKKLYHRQRDFGPCDGCNAVSYRVGLLPDPTGQESLDLPTPANLWHIKKALSGDSFTIPVKRSWED